MSTILLPRLDGDWFLRDFAVTWRYLVCGEYTGCTVFRTVDGRVQVGKMSGLSRPIRTTSTKKIEVRRLGKIEYWPLDGTVWVCA